MRLRDAVFFAGVFLAAVFFVAVFFAVLFVDDVAFFALWADLAVFAVFAVDFRAEGSVVLLVEVDFFPLGCLGRAGDLSPASAGVPRRATPSRRARSSPGPPSGPGPCRRRVRRGPRGVSHRRPWRR